MTDYLKMFKAHCESLGLWRDAEEFREEQRLAEAGEDACDVSATYCVPVTVCSVQARQWDPHHVELQASFRGPASVYIEARIVLSELQSLVDKLVELMRGDQKQSSVPAVLEVLREAGERWIEQARAHPYPWLSREKSDELVKLRGGK